MSNLNEMNTKELKEMAKELKVKNWWTLKKAELIAAIEAVQTETPESVQDESESAVETACDNVIEETEEAAQNEPETTDEDLVPIPGADKLAYLKEEPETKEDNGWELIVKQQLNNAYNWIVGGNENAVSDGDMTEEEFNKWIANEALEEVYHEAITTEYHEDACGGKAPSEMRFAGKKFCRNYLSGLFEKDGYEVEQSKKGKDLIEYNGKTQNLSQWAKELGMPGQTLFARLYMSHWTVEKAFTTPVKKRNKKEEA